VRPGKGIGNAVLLRNAYIRLHFSIAFKPDGIAVAGCIAKSNVTACIVIAAAYGRYRKQIAGNAVNEKSSHVY
jgi:hypothetical protein